MNWHAKSDRLFEEAARSPEDCDKLLKRFKRIRTVQFITMLMFVLVVVAFGVWLAVPLQRILTNPELPAPEWLDAAKHVAMPLMTLTLFFMALQLILLNYTDSSIKMLLLVRGKANATANEEQTRNA